MFSSRCLEESLRILPIHLKQHLAFTIAYAFDFLTVIAKPESPAFNSCDTKKDKK